MYHTNRTRTAPARTCGVCLIHLPDIYFFKYYVRAITLTNTHAPCTITALAHCLPSSPAAARLSINLSCSSCCFSHSLATFFSAFLLSYCAAQPTGPYAPKNAPLGRGASAGAEAGEEMEVLRLEDYDFPEGTFEPGVKYMLVKMGDDVILFSY